MKHFINLIITTLILSIPVSAQTLEWVNTSGDIGSDRFFDLTIDINNDIIVAGVFEGTVDFDPGTGVSNLTSNGSTDIVVVKYNQFGDFLWAKQFGGKQDEFIRAIESDPAGNIVFTGRFKDTADFDPSGALFPLISEGLDDIFTCKLDPFGSLIWANAYGSNLKDEGMDLAIDDIGNITFCGVFRGNIDFGSLTNPMTKNANGNSDFFLLKLNQNGTTQWVNAYGSNSGEQELANDVILDQNGDIVFTGYFAGTTDFDPSNSTLNLTSTGGPDLFISKLNPNGNLIWAKSIGSTGLDHGITLISDLNNDLIIGGIFENSVDFDPGSNSFTLNSNGNWDNFVLKLDASSRFIWAKSFGSVTNDVVADVTIDFSGKISLTGYVTGTADFDPSSASFTINGRGSADAFYLQLDSTGSFNWAFTYGSNSSDNGSAIYSDGNSSIYGAGLFSGSVDFDPTSNSAFYNSNGFSDSYIFKINDCKNSDTTLFIVSCRSYESPSGRYTWNTNGIYTDTIPNSKMCDSIININLFVTNLDTSVVISGQNLISQESNSTYQWLDCSNGSSAVPGANQQSFTPLFSGDFSVELSRNGCVDTSNCINLIITNNDDITSDFKHIKVFPIPVTSGNMISIELIPSVTKVKLTDSKGSLIKTILTNGEGKVELNTSGLFGLYFLTFYDGFDIIESKKILLSD